MVRTGTISRALVVNGNSPMAGVRGSGRLGFGESYAMTLAQSGFVCGSFCGCAHGVDNDRRTGVRLLGAATKLLGRKVSSQLPVHKVKLLWATREKVLK
jgi:hypothetical protein